MRSAQLTWDVARQLSLFLLVLLSTVRAVAQPFELDDLNFVRIATGLPGALDIAHAGDGSGRLYVVRQNGWVHVWEDGTILPTLFLDVTALTSGAGEQGLLGLAFHPNYPTDTRFYVTYTDIQAQLILAVGNSSDGLTADALPTPILTIVKPAGIHNGGQIKFGLDGKLYMSVGDGSIFGDPAGLAQNKSVLLGKMLRFDVDGVLPLSIPPDNPYAQDPTALDEIWHIGLRNPWRFSFDRLTGDMFIGDVGELRQEEINYAAAGEGDLNYGWSILEGTLCFRPAEGCDPTGTTPPIIEYAQDEVGRSVTGGYVYRGPAIPMLQGYYLFADFVTTELYAANKMDDTWSIMDTRATGYNITGFGEDEAGEVYFAQFAGDVFRIAGDALDPCPTITATPLSFNLDSSLQTITVDVVTPTPTCTWTASSAAPWISFDFPGPVSGNGSLEATIGVNTGSFRTAAVHINTASIDVNQDGGANCAPVLDPDGLYFSSAETLGATFAATLDPGCGWSIFESADWIELTDGTTEPFGGIVTLDISENTTGLERSHSLTLPLGVTQHVTQRTTLKQFDDVEPGHFSFDGANQLYTRGITDGCATEPLRYCPDTGVTRGQIAVFIVRAVLGTDEFEFPSEPFFADVPTEHPFFKWIQKFRELGYTSGCSPTGFCPSDPVTREQVAVFLVRVRLGPETEFTFSEIPVFADVEEASIFFRWIQKLSELGITGGCGAQTFCPELAVTRGQMALFIIRAAFEELLP